MKFRVPAVIMLVLPVSPSHAADVRLESLGQFDRQRHEISVNVHKDVRGGCLPRVGDLKSAYEAALNDLGLQVGTPNDAQLEFAVSVKGFPASGEGTCGLTLLSMVRQIPVMKLLRISPGSSSTEYRLWKAESVVTGHKSVIPALLREQATRHVQEFNRSLSAAAP